MDGDECAADERDGDEGRTEPKHRTHVGTSVTLRSVVKGIGIGYLIY